MSDKGKYYEVRGSYTVTVSKMVYARNKEEAMQIAEDLVTDLTDYADGTVGSDDAKVTADGYIQWNEADEDDFYYTETDDCDIDECKSCWEDYDDEEDEEEDEDD